MASIDSTLTTISDLDAVDLFPINRLSPDILAEIFTFCPPRLGECSYLSTTSRLTAPLLLCNVCSSWRALAVSTPRLWQTLDLIVDLYAKPTLDPEFLVSGIRTWLGRSGSLPLTIRFSFYKHDDIIPPKYWPAFEALLQYASRWETVEFHAERGIPWPNLGALPILRAIDVHDSDMDGIPFTSAPQLKTLTLLSCPFSSTSVSAVPWKQLTELTICREQTPLVVLELFLRCSQLESLKLTIGNFDFQGALNSPKIKHTTLQRLVFRFTNDFRATVLDSITLPALTELSLYNDTFGSGGSWCSQLLDLLTRSNCKLQTLSLRHPGFRPTQLLECLEHECCQSLTLLEIEGEESALPIFNNELLVRLTYSKDNDKTFLCPKLAGLDLIKCYCSETASPNSLGRMVQSRCFGRAQDEQLKSLHIITCHPLSKEDYALLHFTMYSGGLEFFYTTFTVTPRGYDPEIDLDV